MIAVVLVIAVAAVVLSAELRVARARAKDAGRGE